MRGEEVYEVGTEVMGARAGFASDAATEPHEGGGGATDGVGAPPKAQFSS